MVIGLDVEPCEAETVWIEFLRKPARRGPRGVNLVISDAHEGLKAAITKMLCATWQRCRVAEHLGDGHLQPVVRVRDDEPDSAQISAARAAQEVRPRTARPRCAAPSVLDLAAWLGNAAEACRRRGMARTGFYEWKRRS